MPGQDEKEDASVLCRLLEESTTTETFTESNKQVFSMLHFIQIDL